MFKRTKQRTVSLRQIWLFANQGKIRHWETKPAILVAVDDLLGIVLAWTCNAGGPGCASWPLEINVDKFHVGSR